MNPIHCPTCGVSLAVPDHLLGQKIRCAKCRGTFLAQPSAQALTEAAPRRHEDFDEAADEAPSRRRRRRGVDMESALAKAQGPGVVLLIAGVAYLFLGFLCAMLAVGAVAMLADEGPARQPDEDLVLLMVVGGFFAVAFFVAGPFLILGGWRLKSLTGRSTAMAGAIIAIVVGAITCLPFLLVGIWPLVVLNDEEVRRAMQINEAAET